MPSKTGELIETRSVNLYPSQHWSMIERHANEHGLRSTSAGLRDILDRYDAMTQAQAQKSPHGSSGPTDKGGYHG